MSKLLAIIVFIALITLASGASDAFMKLARTRGGLAPEQQLPIEGGICADAVNAWECPTYEFFRDDIGFEWRTYDAITAIGCPIIGTAGQAFESVLLCLPALTDYFNGANSGSLVFNISAPIFVEITQYNVGYEQFTTFVPISKTVTKIPDPRVGSGLNLVTTSTLEVIVQTFAPTDLFGQGGLSVGDSQVYDAGGILLLRASRRGFPVVNDRILFAAYNPDRSNLLSANVRNEAMVLLETANEQGKSVLTPLRPTTQ